MPNLLDPKEGLGGESDKKNDREIPSIKPQDGNVGGDGQDDSGADGKGTDPKIKDAELEALEIQKAKLLKDVTDLRRERRSYRKGSDSDVGDDDEGDDEDTVEPLKKQKPPVKKTNQSSDAIEVVRANNYKDALRQFCEKYPEFDPENDVGNMRYNKLVKHLALQDDDTSIGDFLSKLNSARFGAFPDQITREAEERGRKAAMAERTQDSGIGETYSVRVPEFGDVQLTKVEREQAERHPKGIKGYIESKREIEKSQQDSKGYKSMLP